MCTTCTFCNAKPTPLDQYLFLTATVQRQPLYNGHSGTELHLHVQELAVVQKWLLFQFKSKVYGSAQFDTQIKLLIHSFTVWTNNPGRYREVSVKGRWTVFGTCTGMYIEHKIEIPNFLDNKKPTITQVEFYYSSASQSNSVFDWLRGMGERVTCNGIHVTSYPWRVAKLTSRY